MAKSEESWKEYQKARGARRPAPPLQRWLPCLAADPGTDRPADPSSPRLATKGARGNRRHGDWLPSPPLPSPPPCCAGRAPLYRVMEEDFLRRASEEQAAKQQFYAEAVGNYKTARGAGGLRRGVAVLVEFPKFLLTHSRCFCCPFGCLPPCVGSGAADLASVAGGLC